jgi:chromosome segregation ATPase
VGVQASNLRRYLGSLAGWPGIRTRWIWRCSSSEGPAQRTGELDAALRDALDQGDYAAAQAIKDELASARTEYAIAAAAVTGLQTAIAEIERQQAEDHRVIELARQRDAAQARLGEVQRRERETLGELEAEVEHFWSALRAARNVYRGALVLEQRAGQLRGEAHQLWAQLGEVAAGGRVSSPNAASGLPEWHPVVAALLKWERR